MYRYLLLNLEPDTNHSALLDKKVIAKPYFYDFLAEFWFIQHLCTVFYCTDKIHLATMKQMPYVYAQDDGAELSSLFLGFVGNNFKSFISSYCSVFNVHNKQKNNTHSLIYCFNKRIIFEVTTQGNNMSIVTNATDGLEEMRCRYLERACCKVKHVNVYGG